MGKQKMTYDEAASRLNELVEEIESGNLSMSDLSVKVKEAMELIRYCKNQLKTVQEEVEKLFQNVDND